MNDKICDFRFAICDLTTATRRETRSGHDRARFTGFLSQHSDFALWQQGTVDGSVLEFYFGHRKPALAPGRSNRKSYI